MKQFDRKRWARVSLLGLGSALLAVSLGACTPQDKNAQLKTSSEISKAGPGQGAADLSSDPANLFERAMGLVDADPAEAALLLEGAALQGHGEAAYQLALLQKDAKRQVEWHAMAASVGQVDAQFALGEAYLYGRGTAKEPAWGLSWFERAARAGNARAQYAMGLALSSGLVGGAAAAGMHEDGLVWLLIAQKNGSRDADLMIGILQARLSTSAIAAVHERAKAWTNEPAGDAEARATTRFAQHALGRLGFDAGLADGIRGDRTDQAVSAFRVSQGMGAGGLDRRTLDVLRERVAVLNR